MVGGNLTGTYSSDGEGGSRETLIVGDLGMFAASPTVPTPWRGWWLESELCAGVPPMTMILLVMFSSFPISEYSPFVVDDGLFIELDLLESLLSSRPL